MADVIPSLLCTEDMVNKLASRVENQILAEIIHANKAGRKSVLFYVEDGNYKLYIRLLENLGYICQYTQVGAGDYILIRWGFNNVE